jgi:general L-amino acid transport system permease protein
MARGMLSRVMARGMLSRVMAPPRRPRERSRSGVARVAALLLAIYALSDELRWLFLDAHWRVGCDDGGACWDYVRIWLDRFVFGLYPEAERWRVAVVAVTAIIAGAAIRLARRRLTWRGGFAIASVWWVIGAVILKGGPPGLVSVDLDQWSGLLLTMTIATTAMLGSLALGLAIACARLSGRRSVALVARVHVEFWRGIPLITVLFLAVSLFPLMMPYGFEPRRLVPVMVTFVLFYSAYVAEVLRAGFIALPLGQGEAAEALGLDRWRVFDLVLIPQCLRRSVPSIVNILISILKDTTLVLIIGMFDLLGMVQQSLRNAEWSRYTMEGYLFAGAMIWVFCFGLSRLSKRLEGVQR